ncbi:MAG: hypothetical protein H8M99_11150 [Gloeobacteraceae cyanobacterium ES-bin-144]|nr:hypothetical protein [Verrucomicrobiales bacterium]
MQLRHFISGSSIILLGWLAVTFAYRMPAQRYQKQDAAKASPEAKEQKYADLNNPPSETAQVSFSP